jgi:hypothetical protein
MMLLLYEHHLREASEMMLLFYTCCIISDGFRELTHPRKDLNTRSSLLLLLLYSCFTTALLMLYYCFTIASAVPLSEHCLSAVPG